MRNDIMQVVASAETAKEMHKHQSTNVHPGIQSCQTGTLKQPSSIMLSLLRFENIPVQDAQHMECAMQACHLNQPCGLEGA